MGTDLENPIFTSASFWHSLLEQVEVMHLGRVKGAHHVYGTKFPRVGIAMGHPCNEHQCWRGRVCDPWELLKQALPRCCSRLFVFL